MTQASTRPRPPVLARALALAVPAAAGAVLGVAHPRGPVSTAQSLTFLAVAIVVGGASGLLMRSRWAAALTPAVFVVAFEIARLPADGPTVDAIRFDGGLWGAVAFIAGRGFDAIVVLVPMVVAAFWGTALARRRTPAPRRSAGSLRRASLVVASAFVALVAAALARPAWTEPIPGPDGGALPGSLAELTHIQVGGHSLGIMLRGHDIDAPVLLFLEGGPGGTALGAMRYAGRGARGGLRRRDLGPTGHGVVDGRARTGRDDDGRRRRRGHDHRRRVPARALR